MLKRLITFCLVILLIPVSCFAEAQKAPVTVKDMRTQIGENFVAYPQLEGMADTQIQSKINDDLVLSSGAANHLVTLAALGSGSRELKLDYQVTMLRGSVFSVVFNAKGKIKPGKDGQAYTALTYDLATGDKLSFEDFFTDPQAAAAWMEEEAESSLSEEINGYMEFGSITPLPLEQCTLDEDGLTLWYPSDQFLMFSGYAGAIRFLYEELRPFLNTASDSVIAQLDLPPSELTAKEQKTLIEQSVKEGILPHIPVKMHQPMTEIVEQFRLVRTPDEFPGGRYFVMEAPAFRDVLLISDAVEVGWNGSVLEGIQLRRGWFHGLAIGAAKRETWLSVLGKPDETMAFTESMAYDYTLPEGTSDHYHYGEFELRLHADTDGILRAVQLCQ